MNDRTMYALGFSKDMDGNFKKDIRVEGKYVGIEVVKSPCGQFWGFMVGDSSDIEAVNSIHEVVDMITEVVEGRYEFEVAP